MADSFQPSHTMKPSVFPHRSLDYKISRYLFEAAAPSMAAPFKHRIGERWGKIANPRNWKSNRRDNYSLAKKTRSSNSLNYSLSRRGIKRNLCLRLVKIDTNFAPLTLE